MYVNFVYCTVVTFVVATMNFSLTMSVQSERDANRVPSPPSSFPSLGQLKKKRETPFLFLSLLNEPAGKVATIMGAWSIRSLSARARTVFI